MKLESIKYTGIESSPALNEYVEEKIATLSKYVENFGTPRDIRVELEKTTHHHQTGPFFRAEANINIPGHFFRAEQTADDIYDAIDMLKNDLERQLSDYSDKLRTKKRDGGQEMKNMLNYDESVGE
ncbi:ribosome-associated translation inhibitor RaiA [Candidatus Parcubacteria bacterium]|nr:ribosome-associated translation inhibitor RaiA [Patescibacteria group bacterium]MCG2693910.1 ribosome-associated translation inhibitor RaiA [Candidatus Parcubacteria bacterium]